MSSSTVSKRTISLDPHTEAAGKARAARLGFRNSFSAYVEKLIREDLERDSKGAMPAERVEEAA